VSRLRIVGVDVLRYSVLIVRDGEHLSPRMAAAISAVRSVSSRQAPRGGDRVTEPGTGISPVAVTN
jgi:hypothetical protein